MYAGVLAADSLRKGAGGITVIVEATRLTLTNR